MNEQEHQNLFSELIARHQNELYAYIFAIVRNWEDTDDLFQAVCVILWRKFGTFRHETSFISWARQTAQFEVRKFLRDRKTSTSVSDELLDSLAETPLSVQPGDQDPAMVALERCREKLDVADAELLELRYVEDLGSHEIADRLERPQTSVCRSLNRIRNQLLKCVRMELNRHEHLGGNSYE